MPCYHPLRAWRTHSGEVQLGKEPPDGHAQHKLSHTTQSLLLPCGNCLGCRTNRAQTWALRCQLELQNHKEAVFATLTYDDEHKPITLDKTHVSTYLKKIRKTIPNKLRFFASGEYGEYTQRPHYHAIIYGASQLHTPQLEKAWEKGHIHVDTATPANIAYTAGYCSKKIGYRREPHERIDPSTGEVYTWQPPFIQMSRNPGIAAHAKTFLSSWRLYAVKDGHKMKVPRYFKDAWKAAATLEEIDQLRQEIDQLNLHALTTEQLRAAEKLAQTKQKQSADKRNL